MLIISILGIIYPKLVIIWYFRGKDRLYYAYATLFIVLSYFVLFCFDNENFDSTSNTTATNVEDNLLPLKPEKNYLIKTTQFENRYTTLQMISDAIPLNTKIIKESTNSFALNLNSNFKVNFYFDGDSNIISLDALASINKEQQKLKNYNSTFAAIIYSTDPSLLKEQSELIYTQLYNDALLNSENNINFGKYNLNDIEYNLIIIPNESFLLKIFKKVKKET